MSRSSSRSRIVTGPGSPSPTVHSRSAPLTRPTGVMTAAVPQANTSVISPEALPSRHSSMLILRSSRGDAEVGGELEQGVAGDAGQQRAGERGGHDAGLSPEP